MHVRSLLRAERDRGLSCPHKSYSTMEAMDEHQSLGMSGCIRRPRVLYSCGISALTVARKAYHRVEDLGGPVGTMARQLASWSAPAVNPLQRKWLSLLSLADGYILVLEDAVTFVCPPAARLFTMLDKLALLSEAVPKKFDDAADRLPSLIGRLPLARWIAAVLSEGQGLLASAWEHERAGEEREIGVDTGLEEVAEAPPDSLKMLDDEKAVEIGVDTGLEEVAEALPDSSKMLDDEKAVEIGADTGLEEVAEALPDSSKMLDEEKAVESGEGPAAAQRLQKASPGEKGVIDGEQQEEEEATARKPGEKSGEGASPPHGGAENSILELLDEGWCMQR